MLTFTTNTIISQINFRNFGILMMLYQAVNAIRNRTANPQSALDDIERELGVRNVEEMVINAVEHQSVAESLNASILNMIVSGYNASLRHQNMSDKFFAFINCFSEEVRNNFGFESKAQHILGIMYNVFKGDECTLSEAKFILERPTLAEAICTRLELKKFLPLCELLDIVHHKYSAKSATDSLIKDHAAALVSRNSEASANTVNI